MSTHRLNPASPWVVDTRTLGRRPGTARRVAISVPVDEPMGVEVISVLAGAELGLDLLLESVAEGVLVSGTAAGVATGECARCLDRVELPVQVTIRELYAYPDSTTAATTDDDEIPRLHQDLLDLQPLVRDEVVLALPMTPLCRPDCAGLCPECGERLDDLKPDHRHETLDPRWAALAGRFAAGAGSVHHHDRPTDQYEPDPAGIAGAASNGFGPYRSVPGRGRIGS